MNNKIMRYDVYDKKDRWMGSYSTDLNRADQPTALEMARINWKQSGGKVTAIHDCGLEEEVLNTNVITKSKV